MAVMDLTTRTATETAALNLFDRAADVLELEPDLRVALALPERETAVRFPVRMDDGRVRMFNGYRVRHSTARGPAKGGLRYDLSVSLPQLRQLAMAMTLKSALVGLPFGGPRAA
jgi:glutamate dehydrogenase (NAD(P)+)